MSKSIVSSRKRKNQESVSGKSLVPVVVVQNQKATTTSLEVAWYFEKTHKHVLRDIEKLDVSESFSRSNFGPRDYIDERGKVQKMYEMTKNGFAFLAMGYRGKKAAQFKEAYIAEFDRRENEINRLKSFIQTNHANIEWLETRSDGKEIRRSLTDTVKNQYMDYAKNQNSEHSDKLYMSLSKMINKALFDVTVKTKNVRDLLDVPQLKSVSTAEFLTEIMIKAGMELGLHYKKEINPMCKNKVESFAAKVGKTPVPRIEMPVIENNGQLKLTGAAVAA